MSKLTSYAFAAFVASASLAPANIAQAEDYDMDCKLILCLAGGFPQGCADAYSYMIKRITSFPPKPPIGFCALADGSEYQGAEVDAKRIGRWTCKDPSHSIRYIQEDRGRTSAQCYSGVNSYYTGGRDGQNISVYTGEYEAIKLDYQIQVAIENEDGPPFQSPIYRIDFDTNFVEEIPNP